MGWFKRLCMFVFGVAGLLALAALSLTWVGPWTEQARAMLEVRWYFITLEVLVCMAAVALVGWVLMALFAPRNPKETIVGEVPGGVITVTRHAITSQVRHVIEADGTCTAVSVHVRVRKRGHVRVKARVRPKYPMDLIQRGAALYEALDTGLAKICGDSVQSVNVVFTDPDTDGEPQTTVETTSQRTSSKPSSASHGAEGKDISVPVQMLTPTADDDALTPAATEPAVAEEPVEPSGDQTVQTEPSFGQEPALAEPKDADDVPAEAPAASYQPEEA